MTTHAESAFLADYRGAPELVADAMRERITAGHLQPGAKIAVGQVARALGVAAGTLRAGLQLLEHERLVVQRLNRGIFVREVTATDIVDLYSMRRLLEVGALRELRDVPPGSLAAMRIAVDDGARALAARDWSASSRSTVAFHTALVAMLGSERASDTMLRLMAELRLTLAMLHEHADVRFPFLESRRRLVALLADGEWDVAISLLEEYLDHGETAMLAMHAERDG